MLSRSNVSLTRLGVAAGMLLLAAEATNGAPNRHWATAGAGGEQHRMESAASSRNTIKCDVTLPNGVGYPGEPSADKYGNEFLTVSLYPGGVFEVGRSGPSQVAADGSISVKFPWWRKIPGRLEIAGRRVDSADQVLRAEVPDGYGDVGFQATRLRFSSAGCWLVEGRIGARALRFFVRVVVRSEA